MNSAAIASGMSYELLNPDDPEKAFATYLLASPLISSAVGEIPASPPASLPNLSSTPDNSSFARYRELWRWTERVLRRGIILGARICDVSRSDGQNGSLWQLFQQYHACSAHWPPQFRPEQRSAIVVLHLRALILRARAAPTPRPDRSHRWISTARSLVQEYRAILSVCTTFPKAGERNVKVEDLVDLSVATWEADGAVGEYAGWVIDVSLEVHPIQIVAYNRDTGSVVGHAAHLQLVQHLPSYESPLLRCWRS